jgi:histidinol dehydrogenase
MRVIATTDRTYKAAVKKIVSRSNLGGGKVEAAVKTILKAVERGGDAAVSRYTRRFDKVSLKPGQFRVSPDEIKEAYYKIRKEEGDALRYAAHRITVFHEKEKPRAQTWMWQDGTITLGHTILPLDVIGLYVPGGKAVYPSSVLMSAIPAKVAGVKRIIMCVPAPKGELSPYLLVAADIAGVDEVYRVGGVQAIAAMAYGTKTIPRVDKIIGPGNIFVATAKRLVYGTVGIDSIAGPSELLVIADGGANPAHVAADLLCEAEHDESAAVWLVTTSAPLAKEVVRMVKEQLKALARRKIAARAIDRNAMAFVVPTMGDAIALANEIAPEHLSLSVDNPFEYIEKVRHAGALFIGRYTAPAVADYVAGPNHILPTGGAARFQSALSLEAYVRKSNIVSYTKEDLARAKDHIVRLAHMEGLSAHAQSVEVRMR